MQCAAHCAPAPVPVATPKYYSLPLHIFSSYFAVQKNNFLRLSKITLKYPHLNISRSNYQQTDRHATL